MTTNQQPIAGATLVAAGTDDLATRYGLLTTPPMYEWSDVTDADGWVTWSSAPPRRPLNFRAAAREYAEREVRLVADGTEQIVTLEALPAQAPLIVGTVVDATTGENISRFKAIPAENTQFPYLPQYDRSSLYYGTNGNYRLPRAFNRVRIEALGYVPEVGRPQPGPNGEVRCDFRLKREDPAQRIRGVVFNPDGLPTAGVDVALCTLDEGTYLMPGKLIRVDDTENKVTKFSTTTDSLGRYEFPIVRAPHTVVAVSKNGFGRARARAGQTTDVRLEALGTITGVVLKEGIPLSGVTVQLVDRSYDKYPGTVVLDRASFQAVSDDQGRFSIGSVPTGGDQLFIEYGVGCAPGDDLPVQVTSGQTTSLVLGDPDPRGRWVVGHVRASEAGFIGDWSRQLSGHHLVRTVLVPQQPTGLSEDDWQLWTVAWHQSELGRSAARDAVGYRLEVTADGTISASGVRPGTYQLYLRAAGDEPAPGWSAREQREVIIPAADGSDGTVEIGEMTLTIQRRVARL